MKPEAMSPADRFGAGLARCLGAIAERNGSPARGVAALQVVLPPLAGYLAEGHVCAPLAALAASDDPDRLAALRADLLASTLAARPGEPQPRPLVLDAADHLYLYRHYDYERRLAAACRRRVASRPVVRDPARVRERLDELFAASAARLGARPDWQKIAAALAVRNNLTVISGGPGTGKTTTVVNILACLLADDPELRIALAAPTGKAAARMKEALQERAAALPADLRERLPAEAHTVHRLLGVVEDSRHFRHDRTNPVAYDVVVVDEASMLDLALAAKLIEAVPETSRLILLGDKDQLAAVEAGSVFAELSASPALSAPCRAELGWLTGFAEAALAPPQAAPEGALCDCAVWLQENFRFANQPGIGRLARFVNEMQSAEAIPWLLHEEHADVRLTEVPAAELPDSQLQYLLEGFSATLDAVRRGADPAAIHEAFSRFRILCALRNTPRGVIRLNQRIGSLFRERLGHPLDRDPRGAWYPGRPVMVLANDYVLKLFNGDIGIALPAADGSLGVHFPDVAGECRSIDPVRLPPHETAFAMTVHKAQGSEFGAVALVLPSEPARVLTRELIYTGITRARSKVEILGSAGMLEAAMRRPTERLSGLGRQLAVGLQPDPRAPSG